MTRARLSVAEHAGRLLVRWFCDDAATWRAILEDFRACFRTHSERIYLPGERAWSLPLRCRRRLMEWSAAWFDRDDQHWDDDGDGMATVTGVPATHEEALATLYLRPGAPEELVQAAHKVMVRLVHPDKGGSHAQAVAVNRAWEIIERERARRKMGRSA